MMDRFCWLLSAIESERHCVMGTHMMEILDFSQHHLCNVIEADLGRVRIPPRLVIHHDHSYLLKSFLPGQ
jgi:hypothetical protein